MNRRTILIGSAGMAVIAAVVVAAWAVVGGSATEPAESEVVSEERPVSGAAESASRDDGIGEGIGISGDWQLTVLNADGTVAAKHAFHNGLLPTGQNALAAMLARGSKLRVEGDPPWYITLELGEGSYIGSCDPGSVRRVDGTCVVSGTSSDRYHQFADAVQDSGSVVLSLETEQFAGAAVVERIQTTIGICSADGCLLGSESNLPFTGTTISPVNVAPGQRILVTVTLSFGTL